MTSKTLHVGLAVLVAFLVGSAALAQEYAGDTECIECHEDNFNDYMKSGHPWKLTFTGGLEPPSNQWPATPVPPLPDSLGGWDEVAYVIGNFYWKARFIQTDGYIHTGDAVQWNIATQGFVGYHAGETKPFDCGRCHTTGYDPEGHQDGRPGITGTWAQPGVRCEACHGPSSDHVDSDGLIPVPGGKDCAECHYRDSQFRMPWKGGFMRHHQQGEDFSHSPHAESLSCENCHDSHKSVVYGLGGTITECSDCHPGNAENKNYTVLGMESLECIDCHMPKMGKSAVKTNDFAADVRGHIFRVMTDPITAKENTYDMVSASGSVTTFWNQDEKGDSWITLDYACLGCHSNFDQQFSLKNAAKYAKGIHNRTDTWNVRIPLAAASLTATFEEFAGFQLVKATHPDGHMTYAIGWEFSEVIIWMDTSGAIFFGSIDRSAGTASGIVLNYMGGTSIWLADRP